MVQPTPSASFMTHNGSIQSSTVWMSLAKQSLNFHEVSNSSWRQCTATSKLTNLDKKSTCSTAKIDNFTETDVPHQFDGSGCFPAPVKLEIDPLAEPHVDPPLTENSSRSSMRWNLKTSSMDWISNAVYLQKRDGDVAVCIDPEREIEVFSAMPRTKVLFTA